MADEFDALLADAEALFSTKEALTTNSTVSAPTVGRNSENNGGSGGGGGGTNGRRAHKKSVQLDELDDILSELEVDNAASSSSYFSSNSPSGDGNKIIKSERVKKASVPAAVATAAIATASSSSSSSLGFAKSVQQPSSLAGAVPHHVSGIKCVLPELAGSRVPMVKNVCNRLRCTSCDFRVCTFDDMSWDSLVDYLFFRNNVPDRTKLASRLKSKKGARAYACQCTWRTAETRLAVCDDPGLRWVCGRHER